ncbi:beta-1,2-xylosyltransferase [Salix suchowensis]|nr:beta-1,2-xylosyltransferase [Salix suchowensis]
MVHSYRYHHKLKKCDRQHAEEEEVLLSALMCSISSGCFKWTRPKQLFSLIILSLLSCCLILSPPMFSSPSTSSILYSFAVESGAVATNNVNTKAYSCSSVSNGTICCDRSSMRSDVCVMKGDVRAHSASSSIFLFTSRYNSSAMNRVSSLVVKDEGFQHEKIKPYTRKWETTLMGSIDELSLIAKTQNFRIKHHCDVMHDVPAVFFSTGGYTGNLYHEFNDGILPLYITSQQFKKKVVFVILDYHRWWIMKYGNILSLLSDYPAIDFNGDKKTHCFPEAIVGLRIHDELTVDPSLMQDKKSIVDFRNFLDRAYWPRVKSMIEEEERGAQNKLFRQKAQSSIKNPKQVHDATLKKPKLVILSRNGSRAITNENLLVKMAEEIGFRVQVIRPLPRTELARIYRALNSSEVMIGVHGAAMTHFLFMRPGSVFIQVIPLGTEWAADAYYGEPARKLGLKYIGYQILPRESSLYDKYDKNDPVLRDPRSVSNKGWQYTKSIYLANQNVRLNLRRFQRRLLRAYRYSIAKLNS